MTWKVGSSGRPPIEADVTGKWLWLCSLALLALGVVMVHSATCSVVQPESWYGRQDARHTIFAVVAAAVLCTGWIVDHRWLLGWRRGGMSPRAGEDRFPVIPAVLLAGALALGLLVFAPGIGHAAGGRARWIRMGPAKYTIGFQPSELIKLALVVFLAAWLSRRKTDPRSFWRTLVPAMLIVGICVGVVVTQDLGMAVLIAASAGGVMILAGLPWYYLCGLLASGTAAGVLFILHAPQRIGRVAALFDPWSSANPCAYQPRQSLLCILTGGYLGKGLGGGMIKQGFLPEGATDFIFAAFAEETGIFGALLLLGVISIWIWQARRAAIRAEDGFGRLLCGSLGLMIGLQMILHVAVDVVLVPPTGIGLPFVSAGGTALLTTAASAALMISATRGRRRTLIRQGEADCSGRCDMPALR